MLHAEDVARHAHCAAVAAVAAVNTSRAAAIIIAAAAAAAAAAVAAVTDAAAGAAAILDADADAVSWHGHSTGISHSRWLRRCDAAGCLPPAACCRVQQLRVCQRGRQRLGDALSRQQRCLEGHQGRWSCRVGAIWAAGQWLQLHVAGGSVAGGSVVRAASCTQRGQLSGKLSLCIKAGLLLGHCCWMHSEQTQG